MSLNTTVVCIFLNKKNKPLQCPKKQDEKGDHGAEGGKNANQQIQREHVNPLKKWK